jgi:hypothetical protein
VGSAPRNYWSLGGYRISLGRGVVRGPTAGAEGCRRLSEDQADASRDHVAAPVVEIAGIIGVRRKLQVAGFVGALRIPFAKGIAHGSAQGVAMVEVGMGQYDQRAAVRAVAGSEFGLALNMDEGPLVRTKFVLDYDRHLQKLEIVANQDLIFESGGRKIDPADLGVDAEGKIMGSEGETAVDGELFGVIGIVGGDADFAAGDDAGTAVFGGRLFHDQFAIQIEDWAVDRRYGAKFVGSFAGIDVDSASLTIARNHGQ